MNTSNTRVDFLGLFPLNTVYSQIYRARVQVDHTEKEDVNTFVKIKSGVGMLLLDVKMTESYF